MKFALVTLLLVPLALATPNSKTTPAATTKYMKLGRHIGKDLTVDFPAATHLPGKDKNQYANDFKAESSVKAYKDAQMSIKTLIGTHQQPTATRQFWNVNTKSEAKIKLEEGFWTSLKAAAEQWEPAKTCVPGNLDEKQSCGTKGTMKGDKEIFRGFMPGDPD